MTALAAWESGASSPAAAPRTTGRPALRLVPTLPPDAPRLRVTRRGRLVRAAVLVLLGAVVGLALWWSAGAGSARADADGGAGVGSRAVVVRVVEVLPGQTLSHIALAELPQLPVREGVARLQLANDLNTDQVRAGQRLRIPAI